MAEKLPTVDAISGRVSDPPALHAGQHTDGNDDIQDASASQKGLATATQITKLDGIEDGADVTGSNPPQAHATSHTDGSDDVAEATIATKGLMSATDKTKLDGIADGATAYTDAEAEAVADTQIGIHTLLPDAHHAQTHDNADHSTDYEVANANIQAHVTGTGSPHTPGGIGAEPAFTKNTAFNKNFGTGATEVCVGNDGRLSDARTPTSHGIADNTKHSSSATAGRMLKADANGLPIDATNTDTDVSDAVSKRHSQNTDTGTNATNFAINGSNAIVEGDARLTNARPPTAHDLGGTAHNADTLANIGTKISVLGNDKVLTSTGAGVLQAESKATGFNKAVGSTIGTVCAGDDGRLSDNRTPTAHALGGSAHSADSLANLNAKINTLIATYGGIRDIGIGTLVQRPAFGTANRFFWTTDEQKLYRDTGSAWETITSAISSHNHSVASGAGAIATDQIAKFGDGGTTNYAEIQTTGKFRSYGTGRFKRVQYVLAPNMAIGGNLSLNGNTFVPSTYTLISATDRPALFRRFDYTNPLERNYVIAQTVLPLDYVAGTDFEVCIAWSSPATSGNVVWTVGILGISDGDTYNATPTYTALPASTVPGTAYNRKTDCLTITGTNYLPGDCLPIVLLRTAGGGTDTMTDDAYVAGIGIRYISDKLGADV